MTPRFELTAPAEQDLEDIFFEVKARHGRLVAERVYSNLLRTLDLLASMPEMGRHAETVEFQAGKRQREIRAGRTRSGASGPARLAPNSGGRD